MHVTNRSQKAGDPAFRGGHSRPTPPLVQAALTGDDCFHHCDQLIPRRRSVVPESTNFFHPGKNPKELIRPSSVVDWLRRGIMYSEVSRWGDHHRVMDRSTLSLHEAIIISSAGHKSDGVYARRADQRADQINLVYPNINSRGSEQINLVYHIIKSRGW